ncbi:hypothetical protein N9O44_02280, partial [Gammaproteobacteria bacterium]|nr:hypothetical protein [Gammaproteobacteria bacterium]
ALYDIDIEIDSNNYYPSNHKISYIRNDYGLRTDCENPQNINIVIMGGSTTDQRYIDFENTFSYLLQEKLSYSSKNVYCVANAGVDGHKLLSHINSLENWFPLIPSFNPSYYVLNVGINDAVLTENVPSKNSVINTFYSRMKFAVIRNSYLYSFFKKIHNLIRINTNRYGVLTHKKGIENDFEYSAIKKSNEFKDDIIKNSISFGKNFNDLINHIKSRGSKPICITQKALFTKNGKGISKAFPYKNNYLNGLDLQYSLNLINSQMKLICSNEDAIIVDIENTHFTENDFYDFVHHNPQGSKKLADKIFTIIKDQL